MTLQQRFLRYFRAHGFEHIVSRTSKYIVLGKYDLEQKQKFYIFLGHNGAVRQSVGKPSVSQSYSRGELFKIRLELWERKQEKFQ